MNLESFKILICAATYAELSAAKKNLQNRNIDFAETGFGPVVTTYKLSEILREKKYDLVINTGICGSFNPEFPNGAVLNIIEDHFGDIGISKREKFLTAFESGFAEDSFPFSGGVLKCSEIAKKIPGIPKARAITVCNAGGNTEKILQRQEKFRADAESMEGASVLYVCALKSVPALQIRSVSNPLPAESKKEWDIPLALENLSKEMPRIINYLVTDYKISI